MATTTVHATPTKRFFVRSLTRDIALKDAILDLLDNCIDGIVRTLKLESLEGDSIYEGFYAKINLNGEEFEIHDNCGGIPKEIAEKEAFRFGRSNPERDAELETVGMYGIGMKRAVFKMGSHILVESQHNNERYQVEIPNEWLSDENDEWNLVMEDLDSLGADRNGTSIIVSELHPEISAQFTSERDFPKELRQEISQIFALIIRKGFKIIVNGVEVEPVSFDLLTTDDIDENESGIQPYQFQSVFNNVEVNIAIGFYRPLASIDEVEEENRLSRSASNAGITVICNDRVVLYRDKSRTTGWGMKPVPAFHNQFLPIAGIVRFSSKKSENLPLTTTKRGLDSSADIYWYTLDYIKEGLKRFTDFTNQWKGKEAEVKEFFDKAKYKDSIMITKEVEGKNWRAVPKSKFNERRSNPTLPVPPRRNTRIRITFYWEKEEVQLLGEYLYGDKDANPSDIGSFCFEEKLKEVQRQLL